MPDLQTLSADTIARLAPGDILAGLSLPPITRASLALFAGASGDHNPMHIDIDFAREAGAQDVFVHGMLVMAYLGRCLGAYAGPSNVKELTARFTAITPVGAQLHVAPTVSDVREVDGIKTVQLVLTITDALGEVKLEGTARLEYQVLVPPVVS